MSATFFMVLFRVCANEACCNKVGHDRRRDAPRRDHQQYLLDITFRFYFNTFNCLRLWRLIEQPGREALKSKEELIIIDCENFVIPIKITVAYRFNI